MNNSTPASEAGEHIEASPGRILIAEQDGDVRRLLQLLLAREGYEIDAAETAEQALASAQDNPPEVLLVERSLPDMSGLELISQVAQCAPAVETIVMSIDPTVELKLRAMERGAFDLIVKPFPNLKLVAHKVRSALQSAQAIRIRNELAQRLAEQSSAITDLRSELEQAQQQLAGIDPEALSGIDNVTGILGEDKITDQLRTESARALRYRRPLCVVLCGIDGLEAISQRFGEAASEEALRGVAALSHTTIREVDSVGRFGPSEFLFLLPETSKPAGLIMAQRLGSLVEQTPVITQETTGLDPFAVTVSFGLAALPGDTMNVEALLGDAQAALRRARNEGPNLAIPFDSTRPG